MVAGVALTKLPNTTLALSLWSANEFLTFLLLSVCIQLSLKFSVLEQLKLSLLPFAASCLMALSVELARKFLHPMQPTVLALALLCLVGVATYIAILFIFGRDIVQNGLRLLQKPHEPLNRSPPSSPLQ